MHTRLRSQRLRPAVQTGSPSFNHGRHLRMRTRLRSQRLRPAMQTSSPSLLPTVFGQLCKPARRPSSLPSSKDQEPDADAERQANGAPATSTCTTDYVAKPDSVSELFQKNQLLIRGLSPGNVEDYIATVKNVFKEVRQSRMDDGADHMEGQGMAVVRQACPCMEYSPAETQEAEVRLRRGEVSHFPAACRCKERERDHKKYQPRRRSQSQRDSSAHRFTIKHYEQDEDEDEATLFCRERSKRKGDGICSHVIM